MAQDKDPDDLAVWEIASLGGEARAQKLTKEQRSEIARRAAEVRWDAARGPLLEATHEGPLRIGGILLPSAVLEDGTRVLSRMGFLRAIGRRGKAKGGRKYDQESRLPVFLTAANLNQFITKELLDNSAPLNFRPSGGGLSQMGYRADLLPQVCNVFLDAKDAGVLLPNQIHIAERCKILSRGFAVVGITALIDEATGYQEVRDRQALQAILDKFLLKEFAAWAKRFPDEFYEHIFRLRDWDWKGRSRNPPQVVAAYTKDFIYERLTPGTLKELQTRNPTDDRGYRKAKHHQWLTEDIGHPALAQHLHAVIVLMRASTSWDQLKTMLNTALPRRGDTLKLPFMRDPGPST